MCAAARNTLTTVGAAFFASHIAFDTGFQPQRGQSQTVIVTRATARRERELVQVLRCAHIPLRKGLRQRIGRQIKNARVGLRGGNIEAAVTVGVFFTIGQTVAIRIFKKRVGSTVVFGSNLCIKHHFTTIDEAITIRVRNQRVGFTRAYKAIIICVFAELNRECFRAAINQTIVI